MASDGISENGPIVTIRPEEISDHPSIRKITIEAFAQSEFGHNGEADLIERLRVASPDLLSLVAEAEGSIVGHILFSPAEIVGDSGSSDGMALGPMAVSAGLQRQGIGSRLVEDGLHRLKAAGTNWVVVLGHPEFYGRLGFEPASKYGASCEFPGIPAEVFRIRWLSEDRKGSVKGVVKYHRLFRELAD